MAKPLVDRDFARPKNVQKNLKKQLTSSCCFEILLTHTVTTEQKQKHMRTKTLLLAAAALAVSAGISMAQTYSQNVVGYVNLTLNASGYTALNVPVDYDGTGTNNVLTNILSGATLPNGTIIEAWSTGGGSFSANTYGPTAKNTTPHWASPGVIYNPGEGLFVYNPSNYTVNVTVVGTVLQGGLTNGYINQAGYSLVGSQFPVAGGISSTYGYKPSLGDLFESWNAGSFSANTYGTTAKNTTPHWSSGAEPQLTIGQAAFIYTTNTHPVWGTNFVVQ
jgi:hypothetical protein